MEKILLYSIYAELQLLNIYLYYHDNDVLWLVMSVLLFVAGVLYLIKKDKK